MASAMDIRKLKRNELEPALALYRTAQSEGWIAGWVVSAIAKLFDDPGRFIRAVNME